MNSDLVELGWTEDQWNRVAAAVTEEAQRARVAAQALPLAGPEDGDVLAVPRYRTGTKEVNGQKRLVVDTDPTLYLTRIGINVQLRSSDMADPKLAGALQIFRRAANYIARLEDALVFYGRDAKGLRRVPPGLENVYDLSEEHETDGILDPPAKGIAEIKTSSFPGSAGEQIVAAVVASITALENRGFNGPYAAFLGTNLFQDSCNPTGSLVLPRDRILPFLQGPLLRSSAIEPDQGVVIALGGQPIELLVAADMQVSFLHASSEPRWVFRVSERVAVRIKEPAAAQPIAKAGRAP